MLSELWRPFDFLAYDTIVRPAAAVAQLVLYLALIAVALHHRRRDWQQSPLLWVAVLAVCGLFLAPLLPFGPTWLQTVPQPATYRDPRVFLLLVHLVPVMVAAYMLTPSAALVVGLGTGLGQILFNQAPLLALFPPALVGYGASWALQQTYLGRGFALLRKPLVAAPLLALLLPHGLRLHCPGRHAAADHRSFGPGFCPGHLAGGAAGCAG